MLESFFLGPRGENAGFFQQIWGELLQRTLQHRQDTFSRDGDLSIPPPDRSEFHAMEAEIANFFSILQNFAV